MASEDGPVLRFDGVPLNDRMNGPYVPFPPEMRTARVGKGGEVDGPGNHATYIMDAEFLYKMSDEPWVCVVADNGGTDAEVRLSPKAVAAAVTYLVAAGVDMAAMMPPSVSGGG